MNTKISWSLFILAAGVALYFSQCGPGEDAAVQKDRAEQALERIVELETALATQRTRTDSALAAADSASTNARMIDSRTVVVFDSIDVIITHETNRALVLDTAFAVTADSLRGRLEGDTIGLRLLASVEHHHAETVEAERSIVAGLRVQLGEVERARLAWRESDRSKDAALLAQQEIINTQADIIVEHEIRDAAQAARERALTRRKRLTEIAAALVVAWAGYERLAG